MNSGYYAAFAGLLARTQAFDLAANNIANLSTTAYRGQRSFYQSFLASLGAGKLSLLNRAINNYGVLGGATLDRGNGTLEGTGNDLDLALEGPGFFVIRTARGIRYTRNGNFNVSPAGQLVTATGDQVLGEQGPIDITGANVAVSPDGTISVKGAVTAKLKLVDFPATTALTPEGNTYLIAPAGAELTAREVSVRQRALEASNISPVAEMTNAVVLQRHVEMLARVLSIMHTEFNRTAVEDLPRVTG